MFILQDDIDDEAEEVQKGTAAAEAAVAAAVTAAARRTTADAKLRGAEQAVAGPAAGAVAAQPQPQIASGAGSAPVEMPPELDLLDMEPYDELQSAGLGVAPAPSTGQVRMLSLPFCVKGPAPSRRI